ncbi:MAG: phosphoribosylamine--glycine ligase [Chloroflexi bacterium]|nr:phosphoribosylamine--glycine ligase [Chloroflexota bacterium]
MHILVIGSGGREHTLAWKLAQSSHTSRLTVTPGNGGTAAIAENAPIAADDTPALVDFARREKVDLTVVGPEVPLVAGVVDAFTEAGLRAFGPTAAAAQLEGSKAFAKRFMVEEGIPTAQAAIFQNYENAQSYLRQQQQVPIVVKASGLAAGKGVLVCPTMKEAELALHQVMVEKTFGTAGDEALVETCLEGEEVSLLAFSDGHTVVPMLPARDYKRVGEGDQGPNTGGMGCYAPSAYLSQTQINEIVTTILQPTVDGMRRRGTPFVGILYAGLIITSQGPQVIEFNCRFGDPEAQVILPLLESDLVDVFLACLDGRLTNEQLCWSDLHSACVVLASGGYPSSYEKGKAISGIQEAEQVSDVALFHAGTRQEDGQLVTAGGRVLAAMSTGPNLDAALKQAYTAVEQIHFEGAQYRRDIGAGVLAPQDAYTAAGVDINAGDRAVELMLEAVESTYTPAVLAGVGPFGGLFSLAELRDAQDVVLVASTDGVGTKTLIAEAVGRYDTVGQDIVNHCMNDILVQGARPLFFLDYIAAGKLDPEQIATVVGGCATACRALGCALLGGETAEMPGVYRPGTFDLVGTMVGWVERGVIVDGRDVCPGDVCLGVPSSGLHTNGYSLARHVFADTGWETVLPELGQPLGEVLLAPHRAYLKEVEALWDADVNIKAMAHITGGGFPGNIPRVLPPGIGVHLDRSAWEIPEIFRLIQTKGQVDEMEMYRVFNMGIGLVLLVSPDQVDQVLVALGDEAVIIGQAVSWDESEPRVQL